MTLLWRARLPAGRCGPSRRGRARVLTGTAPARTEEIVITAHPQDALNPPSETLVRSTGLLSSEVGDETVIYDTTCDTVHRLPAPVAAVWRELGAGTRAEELPGVTGLTPEQVGGALDELTRTRLVAGPAGPSRRAFLRGAAAAGALAVPAVVSIAAPTAAAAASPVAGNQGGNTGGSNTGGSNTGGGNTGTNTGTTTGTTGTTGGTPGGTGGTVEIPVDNAGGTTGGTPGGGTPGGGTPGAGTPGGGTPGGGVLGTGGGGTPGDGVLSGTGGETLARALPFTGSDAGTLLAAGGALTGTGAALVAAARRLRSGAHADRDEPGTPEHPAG